MDTIKFVGFILLGILGVQYVQCQGGQPSQCMQDLARNEDFVRCSKIFDAIFVEMQQSGAAEARDIMAVYRAMCTPEGKAGLRCIMDFVFECPEIEAAMQMSGTFSFQDIMKQGGIDVFCEMSTSPVCRDKMESCVGKMNQSESLLGMDMSNMMPGEGGYGTPPPGMSPEMGQTPYTTVPMQMAMVCGPMHETMTCILNAVDACPNTADFMEQMMQKMSEVQAQQGGPAMPSYAESKKYILESCPGLPQDFKDKAKQQCLAMSMMKPEFLECCQNVTDSKETHCDVYYGGKECVLRYVGDDCGETYAKAVAVASPLFAKEIPSDCEKQLNGVGNLQASVLTMISTGILLVLGSF